MTDSPSEKTSALGEFLANLRALKGFTLRQVEEATDRDVSNAYLSQLERGKISKPSPHILYSLSEVYSVSYDKLMEKAGYLTATQSKKDDLKHGKAATFAIENLTTDEETALLEYLKFYRTQKKREKS